MLPLTMLPLKSTPGCPHRGWKWLGAVDLHDDEQREYGDYEDCEFCSKEQIRFVHSLMHPDWNDVIRVGRICANNLAESPKIDTEERRLRNRAQSRLAFPNLKGWKISAKGNEWIEFRGYHIVLVRWSSTKLRLTIDGEPGTLDYASVRETKLKSFEVVMKRLKSVSRRRPQQFSLSFFPGR